MVAQRFGSVGLSLDRTQDGGSSPLGRGFQGRLRRGLVSALLVSIGSLPMSAVEAWSLGKSSSDDAVALADLPKEARATHQLIREGGPFPYEKDGSVFGNRERILPREPRGFYREYTVPTPWARDRGARRIICGGQEVRNPDVCYYTQDHYASFRRIAP